MSRSCSFLAMVAGLVGFSFRGLRREVCWDATEVVLKYLLAGLFLSVKLDCYAGKVFILASFSCSFSRTSFLSIVRWSAATCLMSKAMHFIF